MSEKLEDPDPVLALKQQYYNIAQVCLYQYMLMIKEVKDWNDYSARIAPCFALLADGAIEYNDLDIEGLREQVKSLTKQV